MPTTLIVEGESPFPGEPWSDHLPREVAEALARIFHDLVAVEAATHGLQGVTLAEAAVREGAGQQLVATAKALEHVRDLCAGIEGRLVEVLRKILQGATLQTDDGARAKVARPRPPAKRYDNTRILAQIAARAADEVVDRETGEAPPLGTITHYVAERVALCGGLLVDSFSGWRKTALGFHGLALEEYEVEAPAKAPAPAKLETS